MPNLEVTVVEILNTNGSKLCSLWTIGVGWLLWMYVEHFSIIM